MATTALCASIGSNANRSISSFGRAKPPNHESIQYFKSCMPGRRSNTPPGGQPPKHLPKLHLHLGHAPAFSPFIDVSASPDRRVEPLTAPSSPSVDQPYKMKAANSYTTSPADVDYDSNFNKPNSATSD
ncbi:hypothetical protein V6N11_016774 [Hibiscus sabdariffa]|uniref:Uncharacterized protein n=1 Tax=Hibiscus sabdariffa TaxID=183260 RepID=A0ABR2TWC4_9ROSI